MTATPSLKQTTGNSANASGVFGVNWGYSTFIAGDWQLTSVKLFSYRTGSPGTCYVGLRAVDANHKPTGVDLATGTASANGWSTDYHGAFNEVTLNTPYTLTNGTEYAIVVRVPGGDGSNLIQLCWGLNITSLYRGTSSDSGVTWSAGSGASNYIQLWGVIKPTCTTQGAINLTKTSERLSGTVDTMGDYSPIHVKFFYGTTAGYGSETASADVTSDGLVTADVTGLTAGITYHYAIDLTFEY